MERNLRPFEAPPRFSFRASGRGGSELLVWLAENSGVESSRILLPGVLVEWSGKKGLETGTPCYLLEGPGTHGEEEYLVEFDSPPDTSKLAWGRTLLSQIAQDHLPREIGDFLLAKMAPRKDPGLNNTETKGEAS